MEKAIRINGVKSKCHRTAVYRMADKQFCGRCKKECESYEKGRLTQKQRRIRNLRGHLDYFGVTHRGLSDDELLDRLRNV